MRMEQEKDCIKNAEQSFKKIFSQKRIFSLHLEKWQDDDLYDMYDHNQFVPVLDSTKEGIRAGNRVSTPVRKKLF